MTKPKPAEEVHARPFAEFLQMQAKGKTHAELSNALHELTGRVKDTGKKGVLTYVIAVEPMSEIDGVKITDEIKLRMPEHKRETSVYWTDDEGNLTRSDPRQLAFEGLQVIIPKPAADLSNVDTGTGEIREVN